MGGLLGNLGLFPFMFRGSITTNEEADNAKDNGMYNVFGSGKVTVITDYSLLVVFHASNYIIQLVFRLGDDAVSFRRCYNEDGWSKLCKFTLDFT